MAAETKRKVQGPNDAVALLEEFAESDLEFKDFCGMKGVDGRSLQCWRTNLARQQPGDQPVRLVELVSRAQQPPARYRVHVDDWVVEVDDTFQSETLARLLEVVASC